MTNEELEIELAAQIKNERVSTDRILTLINLAEDRDLPLLRGYSGILDWLVEKYGYSKSSAWRRVEAARLLRTVPEARDKLQSGVLNLTNLAKARASIRAQEKKSRRKMKPAEQAEIVDAIENQTEAEAEITLLRLLPETASSIHREHVKQIDEHTERWSLNFSREDGENLAWIKDYLSHAMPEANSSEIISRLMREFRQKNSASKAKTKVLKAEHRTCEYQDEVTGKVCGATLRVENDHDVPKAMGGVDAARNRRCLCRQHNQFEARRKLGRSWANAWRRKNQRPAGMEDGRDRAAV